jgi:hypothetical protein
MACALLVSAIAAQSASATNGTTAFTCKEGKGSTDSHCVPGSSGTSGHVEIKENTTTSLRGRSVGSTKLKATVGGIPITLTSTELEGAGSPWMKNLVDSETKEHYIFGEGKITYKEVTVSGAGKECFVYEDELPEKKVGAKGMITTEQLEATTTGQGASVRFKPTVGEVFARFWITDGNKETKNCVTGGTYIVSGLLSAKPNGATLNSTHAEVTTANTLTLGLSGGTGFKAGLEGSLTLEGEDTEDATDTWAPLSTTTVTT